MCLIHGAQDYWGNRFNRYLSLGDLAESNALQLMKVSLVFSGEDAYGFFLHGYGRYVCREAQVTLVEFEKKAEKIRARTKETQQPEHQNTKPNNQTQNPQQAKPEPKLAHICSGCEKRSEDPKI